MSELISRRVSSIPKSAIHEMTRLSKQMEDVAFLSWAKPTSGTPKHINEAAVRAIREGKTSGYSEPAGLPELRELIAQKLKSFNHVDASPEEVIVTVGAIEGIAAAIMAVVDPGDEVVVPAPCYSSHVTQVLMASCKPVFVQSIEDEGFRLDIDGIGNAVNEKTKALLFCDPNNPTGSVYSREELESLASIARDNNLAVITDEAYEYFTFDGCRHVSMASLPGMKERTISAFAFTKTYAMTGWRIGYIHVPGELVPHVKKAHIPFAICAPVVSQYAAMAALGGDQACVDEFREHYQEARNLMCDRLDAMSEVFDYQKPAGSYLMFPGIRLEEGADSLSFARRLLEETRVSTTPGVAFHGESHLRMSFCVPMDMIEKAFDRMEQWVKSSG